MESEKTPYENLAEREKYFAIRQNAIYLKEILDTIFKFLPKFPAHNLDAIMSSADQIIEIADYEVWLRGEKDNAEYGGLLEPGPAPDEVIH